MQEIYLATLFVFYLKNNFNFRKKENKIYLLGSEFDSLKNCIAKVKDFTMLLFHGKYIPILEIS